MNTNRKVFGNSSPTLRTDLRGIFGRNFNYFTPSFRRFETKDIEELKPGYVSHRPVKTMVVAIPGVHLLNTDSIVFSKELISYLKMEVTPLVPNLLVGFGNQNSRFSPSVRAFDSTGKPLLPHTKHILSFLEEVGVSYPLTIRGDQKGLAAYIYTYRLTSRRQGLFGDILAREAYIPLARRTSTDGDCFNVSLYKTGKTELKPTYIPDSEVFAFQSPASLFQCEAVIPIPTFEAGESSFAIAVLNPAKETSVGLVQPLQHLLKHLRAYITVFREGSFKLRELFNLVKAGDRAFVLMVNGYTLLKSCVVESTTKFKPVIGFAKYLRSRQEAILKRLFHLPSTMSNLAYLKEGDKPENPRPLGLGSVN